MRALLFYRHCRAQGLAEVVKYVLLGPLKSIYAPPEPDQAIFQYHRFRDGTLEVDGFAPCADGTPCDAARYSLESEDGATRMDCDASKAEFRYAGKIIRGVRFRFRVTPTMPPGRHTCWLATPSGKRRLRAQAGLHFPLSPRFRQAYLLTGTGHILRLSRDGALLLQKYTRGGHAVRECAFCLELLCIPSLEGLLAVILRISARVWRLLSRRRIWLFSDKLMNPFDSAYAAALALRNSPEFAGENISAYYMIDRREPRRKEIRRTLPVVSYRSFRHALYALVAEANVTSEGGYNPFLPRTSPYLDLMARQIRAWSGHGIIHHDLSAIYGKDRQNFNLLALGVARERDSLLSGLWGYDPDELALTGLARWDCRHNRPRKTVYFVFTWRAALVTRILPVTQQRCYDETFADSLYCRRLTELLSSPRLREAAGRHGYALCFVPHPLVQPALRHFAFPASVEIILPNGRNGKTYEEIYAEAALLVTDYSSVAMDMAYLGKPVIYYQFDRDAFYATQGYTPSYFSWERDGFGEVLFDPEAVIDRIVAHLEKGCIREEPYNRRAAEFFTYQDGRNGIRTCRAILDHLRQRGLC